MKAKLLVVLLAMLPRLFAQDKPTPPVVVTKLVMLQNDNVDAHLLDGIGLNIKRSGKAIVITGPEETVNAALVILKQLDVSPPPPVPAKSIELTAYMLIASPKDDQGIPVPAELNPVVRQLRTGLAYKSFNLLETAFLRVRNQGQHASTEGALSNPDLAPAGDYTVGVNQISLLEAEDRVRIHGVNVALHVRKGAGALPRNDGSTMRTISVETDVDIKPGQQIVIGKANLDQSGDALIVVLTAKVVD